MGVVMNAIAEQHTQFISKFIKKTNPGINIKKNRKLDSSVQ